MPEEWVVGARYETRVNFVKLIKDLRDQFPYDPLSSLIVETFANSIDAKASHIKMSLTNDGSVYQIIDNGKGMNQSEFVEYHNIASLTKAKGEGIGFAGVGAKIFLDRCEYIITETKSRNFHAASKWAFISGTPIWESIPTQNRVENTGTFVEVKIKIEEDCRKLTSDIVAKMIRDHYNSILLDYYQTKELTINGRRVEPWLPFDVEERKDFDFRYGGHRVRGFFIKARNELPDEFQGPYIVVHGKTIQQHWFKQYPLMPETFTGLILADYLIKILRTSKAQFDYTSMLWKKFHAKMGRVFSNWLDEIGAKPRPPTVSTDLDRLSSELERTVNEILKMPELTDLANSIFQNITQRIVGIRSTRGELSGIEVEGTQLTTGTLGGSGEGEGVETIGDEGGRGVVEEEGEDTPIERVRRRVRGGIKIGWDNQPENLLEGWIDPGKQAITVNMGHSAFKVAEGLSQQIRAEHVLVYHTLRTVVSTMLEEAGVEAPKKAMANILSEWYERYIGVKR